MSSPSAVPAGSSTSPVSEQARRTLDGLARRLSSRERRAFQLLLTTGAIWPTSGVDRSTVRRLQAKGLAQLVTFDRTCWVGKLSDRYGTPWATVRLPAPPRATPATADDVAAMERAERDQAMFEAKRHNGDHGYDYAPVLSETGAMVGWRYRSTLGGHGWATVDGQLCPENVESSEEAQEQARVAHHAGAVASAVVDAARRLHPTAHLFRPVRSTTTTDEGTEEVLGWTFQCRTSPRGYGWITTDRSVWRALYTDEAAASASLRRWHDLGRRAEEAERLVRETVQVPTLLADQAEAIAVTAHGEVQELLAFAPRSKVLGYTYRTEAGYGWVTAYGTHTPYAETSRDDAEQLIPLALVDDRKDGRDGAGPARALQVDSGRLNLGAARAAARKDHRRACLFEDTYDEDGVRLGWTYTVPGRYFDRGQMTYGWIVENGRTGQLVNSRDDARAELAEAWATDRVAALA